MTNSRLTDPEVLELRFPVVLEDFHVRRGSGGKGRFRAGDGVSRTIRFLEDMELAILSGRRRVRAFGAAGGEPGEPGRNLLRRADGSEETLPGCASANVSAGDAVTIVTPTGGGWGKAEHAETPSPRHGSRVCPTSITHMIKSGKPDLIAGRESRLALSPATSSPPFPICPVVPKLTQAFEKTLREGA